MKYRNSIPAILLFLVPGILFAAPPYVQEIPPLVRVPGEGVSFVIPDEQGWKLFDPDGKGSTIVKFGQTEIESYAISLDLYRQKSEKSEQEFKELYEASKLRELEAPRYIQRIAEDEFDLSKDKPYMSFYYLVEDHEATGLPENQEYVLLETMGYFAIHPIHPDVIVRVAYSYRYTSGHEDTRFKEKADWVLDRAAFTDL